MKPLLADLSVLPLSERPSALAVLTSIPSKAWLASVTGDPNTTFFLNADGRTDLLQRLQISLPSLNDATIAGISRGVSPDIAEPHVLSDNSPDLAAMEPIALRRSISGKLIKRYTTPVPDQWLIYTTREMNPKSFPRAYERLGRFKSQNTCKEVSEGKHPWWALHRPRDPSIFASPKIIGLTTTKRIEVIFDNSDNLVVTDAMYVFRLKSGIHPMAALGVLHSSLFLFLYRVSNQGEARVIPQIKAAKLGPLPFPDLANIAQKAQHDRMVQLVEQMLKTKAQVSTAKTESDRTYLEDKCAGLDRQIDQLTYDIYDLTPEEVSLVEHGS